jgi:hypothetical protein
VISATFAANSFMFASCIDVRIYALSRAIRPWHLSSASHLIALLQLDLGR